MTNLKQVTIESDEETVSGAHPLPIQETGTDLQERILYQLIELNLHLRVITNQKFSAKDIKET